MNIRPNIRYDSTNIIDVAFRPFDGKKDQFLFSLDTIPFSGGERKRMQAAQLLTRTMRLLSTGMGSVLHPVLV